MKTTQTKNHKNGATIDVAPLVSAQDAAIPAITAFESKDMHAILETMHKLLHWAAIIDSSDDAIISKSADGYITSWNPAAERLYGYAPEEVIGQPASMLMPEEKEDDFSWIMEMLHQGKRVDHHQTKRKTKDGRILDVSITVSPIKDATGRIVGASKIARNITDQLEEERQKDVFISAISHELRTPITTQTAYGEILEQLIDKNGDEKYKKYVVKINEQTKKLTKLVNDLLELSRINSTNINITKEKFDLDQLITSVAEDMQTITKHKVETDLKASCQIHGDKERISQVLANLMSNAIKYSPRAEKICVRSYIKDDQAIVEIEDFGIGIDKKDMRKIFEKFYRATNTNTQSFPGMGIGLSISQEVVQRHGGKIWVESQVKKGSTFYLSLPLSGQEGGE